MNPDEQKDRDILPEYDFTSGVRGRYAPRLKEAAAAWAIAAPALDAYSWLGHALARSQEVEAVLVVYFVLVRGEQAATAGPRVREMTEQPGDESALNAWRELKSDLAAQWVDHMLQFIHERNWIVHRSFLDFERLPPGQVNAFIARLEKAAADAAVLKDGVFDSILDQLAAEGVSADTVRARADLVVQEWAAAS